MLPCALWGQKQPIMAVKETGITYEAVMRDLVAQNFAPVYLLMGDEPYFIDKISAYIEEHALQPEEKDFNQVVAFGSDITAPQVVDLARDFPLMASRRVVIIKEAQGMKSGDGLEKYLTDPVPSTVLVLCYKGGKADRGVVAKAKAKGVVFESKKKRDYELPAFVEGYVKMQKAVIDHKAAEMIADHVGSDLARLTSEVDKVLISLPEDNRQITPEVVEEQIGISKDFNIFELKNAVVAKDVFKANQIMNYFDNNPKAGSLYAVVPLLFNYFQNLMIAFYAPERTNENSVASFLGLKSPGAAKEYISGMRNYNAMKVMQIIHMIKSVDARSKGLGNVSATASDLAKELLFFIMH